MHEAVNKLTTDDIVPNIYFILNVTICEGYLDSHLIFVKWNHIVFVSDVEV